VPVASDNRHGHSLRAAFETGLLRARSRIKRGYQRERRKRSKTV